MSKNVINAVFGLTKYCRTASRYQWDKGQTLKIIGASLPNAYRVDFSTDPKGGESESCIGDADGVQVPNAPDLQEVDLTVILLQISRPKLKRLLKRAVWKLNLQLKTLPLSVMTAARNYLI